MSVTFQKSGTEFSVWMKRTCVVTTEPKSSVYCTFSAVMAVVVFCFSKAYFKCYFHVQKQ